MKSMAWKSEHLRSGSATLEPHDLRQASQLLQARVLISKAGMVTPPALKCCWGMIHDAQDAMEFQGLQSSL